MRGKCASCSVVVEAERVARNYQISQGEGIKVPTWLFFLGLGTFFGMVIGPSLMATTAAGSARLAELSRQHIERR